MKNLINYYYDLFITEFKKANDSFYFEINGKKYEFIAFLGDIKELYDNYLIIRKNNKYCHEIIVNKDNTIVTLYNNIPYILIKKNLSIDKYVDLDEIINYDIPILEMHSLNWKNLWKQKIDYYEYQMSQVSFKYPILKKAFDYYVGLTETAISLLNYVDNSNINYYVCHKRIAYKEKLCAFFNPTEFIIDNRTRDIAEYVKINYIHGEMDLEYIYRLINYLNFSLSESVLFLSRLVYPSYFFDMYDEIIQDKVCEEKMLYYIKKASHYETLLKKIYIFLKNIYPIPEIEWLNSN